MYVPALILLFVFIVYPFISGFRIAFTNWNGFSQHYKYVGFENIVSMVKDKNVGMAIINTLIYGFGSMIFQQLLGLAYAVLLNKSFKMRNFSRTLIYLPVLISAVVMGYMWSYITRYDGGALNDILKILGKSPIFWLSNRQLAIGILLLINITQYVGISMVIYLAGLQGIPGMYYEAAEIDSANSWQQFKYITIPMLYPAIITSVTLNLIGGLKLFDVIKALTNGGPDYSTNSLSSLLTDSYFKGQNAGYAACEGVLLFLMILIIMLIIQKVFMDKEVNY